MQDGRFEQVTMPHDRALFDYSMALYQAVKAVADVEGKIIDQTLWTLLKLNWEKMRLQCGDIFGDMRQQGRAEGRINERVENIRNLAKNMQWTIERAMDALGIAPTEREICLEALKEQSA